MTEASRRFCIADTCGAAGALALPPGFTVRLPADDDREGLAAAMLEGYRGTIDFEGTETIQDARNEVDDWYAGEPLPGHSLVALDPEGRLASATLLVRWRGLPLVAYAFTLPEAKGRGLATTLLRASMASLCAAGEPRLALWVTVGNEPAESIYARLGFVDAPVPV